MTQKPHQPDQTSSQTKVIVYGLDETGKPKAAWFAGAQAQLATKAAKQLKLNVAEITNGHGAEVLKRLTQGRIHASGRGFLPHVRKDLYEKVLELARPTAQAAQGQAGGPTAGDPSSPAGNAGGSSGGSGGGIKTKLTPGPGLPRDWEEITTGHLVLANESGPEGWWEAIVVATDQDMLMLRWRDYPKAPNFTRHRSAVALIRPPAG